MKTKLLPATIFIATATLMLSYLGYVDIGIRAASELQWDERYQESAERLERLRPLVFGPHRRQLLLKLAFNYRYLHEYDKLRSVAIQLESDYPNSNEGYFGQIFQAECLSVEGRYEEALALLRGLLSEIRPGKGDDLQDDLRQRVRFEMAVIYNNLGDTNQSQLVLEELRNEYPESPYLERARKIFP